MAIIVEIHSAEFSTKSGTSARTNKPYSIREQVAYVHIGDVPYPTQIKITLDDGKPSYAPGKYHLADDSFFVGQYADLKIRPRLVPIAAAATQQKPTVAAAS
ncbi:G5P family DNA-binding protein [Pseudomonas sp. D1-3]